MGMTSWRKELRNKYAVDPDNFEAVECSPADDRAWRQTVSSDNAMDWDRKFQDGYGGENGQPFVAWTQDYVYFCCCYDGSEWVQRVPRNPEPIIQGERPHFGG